MAGLALLLILPSATRLAAMSYGKYISIHGMTDRGKYTLHSWLC